MAHLDWLVREKDKEEKLLCYVSIIHLASTLANGKSVCVLFIMWLCVSALVPTLDKDINLLIKPVLKFLQNTGPPNTK